MGRRRASRGIPRNMEGVNDADAAGIAEITGISAGNVATKIHRIKKILASRFNKGERNGR